jgi:D-alanyl-D-alanine-carboxypeptidase/D-alanyl-D-alanine-endopeptidase
MISQIHIKSPLSLKILLTLSLFSMILIASSGFPLTMTLHYAKAQHPAASSSGSNTSESYNIFPNDSNGNLSTVLLNQIVIPTVLESEGNKSGGGVSIVVGVITPNGTSVSGYGNISKADSTKVNGDAVFRIGSITKLFTNTLLADMVQRGIVKFDDPIEKYLPSNVTVPSYNGHEITLEDLATQYSGLPEFPTGWIQNHSYTTQQVYDFLSNSSLMSEPGTRFIYSNFGAGILGHILSLKAGVSYEQLVRDRILNVLGMNNTGIAMNSTQITPLPDHLQSRLAKGHTAGKEVNQEFITETLQGAGAMYSTTNDLLKFLSANMGLIHTTINDALQDTHLIRHHEFTKGNWSVTDGLGALYDGLTWQIITNLGGEDTIVAMGAATDGYTSFIAFNPTKQIGLVVLCSCDEADNNQLALTQISLFPWLRGVPISDS